ncbi:MAG: hypothetical protein JWQ09_4967 [Segetibacter sp.]|nr:hypothetical protein [Segetibacter sp.]
MAKFTLKTGKRKTTVTREKVREAIASTMGKVPAPVNGSYKHGRVDVKQHPQIKKGQ